MTERRATDRERETAAEILRQSWVEGAVSTDTFEARLGLVLSSGDQVALATLTHDLPRRTSTSSPDRPDALMLRLRQTENRIVLGRHRSCERVFDDDSVSRRHALIRRATEGLRLLDLDSTNGTWLNGERVNSAVRIAPGDLIRLGRVVLRMQE